MYYKKSYTEPSFRTKPAQYFCAITRNDVSGLDVYRLVCYALARREGNGKASYIRGGDNMTVLEVLALLNLLAVVIFGVINITKKQDRPQHENG